MKIKETTLFIKVITIILILFASTSFYRVASYEMNIHKTLNVKHEVKSMLERTEDSEIIFSKEKWYELKAINDDFVGYIWFPQNWIAEPIVQGTDNTFYLTNDLNRNRNEFGTVYMDTGSNPADQNITIYGHNVFMSGDLMFTPLARLVDQSEFEHHHSFRIYWQDDCREYEITSVYYWDEVSDRNFDYKQADFVMKEEFDEYKKWIDQHNLIISEESLDEDSSFVSLQTCKDLSSTVRIIVTAKEINRSEY